jgi:hypothetical protein
MYNTKCFLDVSSLLLIVTAEAEYIHLANVFEDGVREELTCSAEIMLYDFFIP